MVDDGGVPGFGSFLACVHVVWQERGCGGVAWEFPVGSVAERGAGPSGAGGSGPSSWFATAVWLLMGVMVAGVL